MLTWYSILPRLLLLILSCYELALAMFSFRNMPSCCRYACFIMHTFVVSASSSPRCLHIIVSAMLCFLLSLKPVNETCYVYMGAIISSVPFWLMVSKGLVFYTFSSIMPFLMFLWYVPLAWCLLALNIASWCCFCHVCIFTKSMMLLSFALLSCLFEHVIVWSSHSSVFIFCQASPVDYCHMLCCYVGVL